MERPCIRNRVTQSSIPATATEQPSLLQLQFTQLNCNYPHIPRPSVMASSVPVAGLGGPEDCKLEIFQSQTSDWGEASIHVDAPSLLTGDLSAGTCKFSRSLLGFRHERPESSARSRHHPPRVLSHLHNVVIRSIARLFTFDHVFLTQYFGPHLYF